MKILHFDEINNTLAVPVALDAWHALRQQSLCQRFVLVAWDDSALVAVSGEHDFPLGILTYRVAKWRKVIELQIGFVYPEQRRRGVYRALWNELVIRGRMAGVASIESGTAATNEPMRAALAALGRPETGVYTSFAL